MLEKEKVLKQMAEADKQPVKLGGMGRCYKCGEFVSNLALHEARCGQWTEFSDSTDPVLKELARADLESRIILDPKMAERTTDTKRKIRG